MLKTYVAHPYGGKLENKTSVENIIKELVNKDPEVLYISPIHALGYLYDVVSYDKGMEYCIGLLEQCDELLLCDGWRCSIGCVREYAYAMENNIPIIFNGRKDIIYD